MNRNIPAGWIQWLCTDRKAAAKVGVKLELDYARIAGDLNDLEKRGKNGF